MIKFIKKIFGLEPEIDFKGLIQNGALIMDVRTKLEFERGHILESQNYPLNTLAETCQALEKDRLIITCCATGMRSASAKQILKSRGFENVYNGGGWVDLDNKIR